MENKTCYLCGAEIDSADTFCKKCGAKVVSSDNVEPLREEKIDEVKTEAVNKEETRAEEKAPFSNPAPHTQNPAEAPYYPYGYPYPPYPPQYGYNDPNAEPKNDSPYHPISTWAWVGINFLLAIPLVNVIVLIIWACGGSKNVTLKNYSRGYWLTVLLSFALSAVVFIAAIILGVSIGLSNFELYQEYFDSFGSLSL